MRGTLPTWLEPLLGLDAAESGEGTIWKLSYHWPWPAWLTLLAALAACSFIATMYFREAGAAGRGMRILLVAMRLCVVGLLAFMIAQVALSLERTGLPYLVFAVDDSASMGIVDRYDDPQLRSQAEREVRSGGFEKATRLNLAKSLLVAGDGELLRDAGRRHKLRLYFVSDAARSESGESAELVARIRQLEPSGESTRLGQGVRSILNDLRGTPPSAIVLFTDGVNTEGESLSSAAAYARRKGVPLFTVALGNEKHARDLVVSDLLVDEVVFVDDVVNFEFTLTGHGFAGKRVDVLLREKNEPAPLAKTTVVVGADGEAQKARIPYRPTQVGEFEYIVEVPGLPDEAQSDNNRQERLVSVRKDQIRVLIVQAYPNYEFRYLKHLLQRDSTIEVHTLLQEADPGYAEIDQAALRSFPVRREDLFRYDVVIFGDVNPSFLGTGVMRNLSEFVSEKGGGLVFIAGPRYMPAAYRDTPLAALLPLDFDGAGPGQAIVGRRGIPGASHRAWLCQSDHAARRHARADARDLVEASAAVLDVRGVEAQARGPRAGGASLALRRRRSQAAAHFIAVRGGGQGVVSRHRRHVALALSSWRRVLRPLLDSNHPLPEPREAVGQGPCRRALDGSPRVPPRRTGQAASPLHRRAAGAGRRRRRHRDARAGGKQQSACATAPAVGEPRGFRGLACGPDRGSLSRLDRRANSGRRRSGDRFPGGPRTRRVRAHRSRHRRIAARSAETRGQFFTLASATQLGRSLPEGRQVPIETLLPIELWNRWTVVLALVGLLIGEWLLRKRHGMV